MRPILVATSLPGRNSKLTAFRRWVVHTGTFGTDFPVYCIDIFSQDISNKHKNESSGSTTRDTIVSIVKRFFENFDCALVAFIDTSTDKKGKARYRMFRYWFNAFKDKDDDFSLESREINATDAESYSLLIFRKSYGNSAKIISDFDNFIKLANTPCQKPYLPNFVVSLCAIVCAYRCPYLWCRFPAVACGRHPAGRCSAP